MPITSVNSAVAGVMQRRRMEKFLSKAITIVVSGSMFLIGGIFILAFGIAKIIEGDWASILSMYTLKVVVIATLYIISIYLVANLPGKSVRQRIICWVYSMVFHGGLLIYVGVASDLGGSVVAIGLAEALIVLLSAIGMLCAVGSIFQKNA